MPQDTPETYRVILSPKVSARLHSIHTFISHTSLQNAPEVIERLLAATYSLEFFPFRYDTIQRSKPPERGVRLMPVPPHVIYYRVIPEEKVVRILTVLHGAQRRPKR